MQCGDESGHTLEPAEQLPHLAARQDDGQSAWRADASHDGKGAEWSADDMFVQEEKGGEGLVLSGGADVVARGKDSKEGRDLPGAELGGMLHAVVCDEATGPEAVGLFGAGLRCRARQAARSWSMSLGGGMSHCPARTVPGGSRRNPAGLRHACARECTAPWRRVTQFLRSGYVRA